MQWSLKSISLAGMGFRGRSDARAGLDLFWVKMWCFVHRGFLGIEFDFLHTALLDVCSVCRALGLVPSWVLLASQGQGGDPRDLGFGGHPCALDSVQPPWG